MHADAVASLSLDRSPGAAPLPLQLASNIRTLVAAGTLRPGDRVPSTRAVAKAVGVARGTVAAAYDQLTGEGYLIARERSGVRVNPTLPVPASPPRIERAISRAPTREPAILDFSSGHEPAGPVDDPAWRTAWRSALHAGSQDLPSAIASHLRLVRAMAVHPHDVIVTAGARAGLALLLTAASRRSGAPPRVAVESPGFPGLRRLLEIIGVDLVPVPVEADGMDLAALDAALPLDLVLVTPNHQFPHGTAMPAAGRQALIGWATRTGVLLVEDDYDSEYRHFGPPLPPLWSLGPEVVAHVGTFAAVLGRDVGAGYVMVPPRWRAELDEARLGLGGGVAPILQRALAGYLEVGGLRRRLARSRRRSEAARSTVGGEVDGLRALPSVLSATDTGHLLVVELPAAAVDPVRRACTRRGLLVADLAEGWAGNADRSGILVNYGGHDPDAVRRALRILHAAVLECGTNVS